MTYSKQGNDSSAKEARLFKVKITHSNKLGSYLQVFTINLILSKHKQKKASVCD